MLRKKHISFVVARILNVLALLGLLFIIVVYRDVYLSRATIDTQVASTTQPYLTAEEAVIVKEKRGGVEEVQEVVLPVQKVLFEYVQVTDGCGPHFEGECLRVRAGPGTDFPIVSRLRNGMVLKVGGKVERDGMTWYKIVFDEWLRYPERLKSDWYVSASYVHKLLDEGDRTIWDDSYATSASKKKIVVDCSEQKLYAYEGDTLFMGVPISTGLALTPTPRGTFKVYKKTPSRYMQGPLPNIRDNQYYDLPGVPWNLYFTQGGAVIHGAYWHTSFGSPYSHGCVNLAPETARKLYTWAQLGTTVVVRD